MQVMFGCVNGKFTTPSFKYSMKIYFCRYLKPGTFSSRHLSLLIDLLMQYLWYSSWIKPLAALYIMAKRKHIKQVAIQITVREISTSSSTVLEQLTAQSDLNEILFTRNGQLKKQGEESEIGRCSWVYLCLKLLMFSCRYMAPVLEFKEKRI